MNVDFQKIPIISFCIVFTVWNKTNSTRRFVAPSIALNFRITIFISLVVMYIYLSQAHPNLTTLKN